MTNRGQSSSIEFPALESILDKCGSDALLTHLLADYRDLGTVRPPPLRNTAHTPLLSTSSTLRGLAQRWSWHRSGRFGWGASWAGKDRFDEIANLEWFTDTCVFRWNGRQLRLPRFSAYRILAATIDRWAGNAPRGALHFVVDFNPVIALVIATRHPCLPISISATSQLAAVEIDRFLTLCKLPSYILDFIPAPVRDAHAHSRIRLSNSPTDEMGWVIHIEDMCRLPFRVASSRMLNLSPRTMVVGSPAFVYGVTRFPETDGCPPALLSLNETPVIAVTVQMHDSMGKL